MLSKINALTIGTLSMLSLVQAVPSVLQHWRSRADGACVPGCASKISKIPVYDCLTSSNESCPCDFDPDAIIHTLRCTFDCATHVTTSTHVDAVTERAVCGPRPSPPKGTRASSFSLPACASDCLTPANFKFNDTALQCADPSDPECVCQMIYGNGGAYLRDPRTGYYTGIGNDTLKYTDFNYQKCMLDTCDEQEAAVAIIQMGVDCGEFSATAPTSQFPFPQNKLKSVFDTVNSRATLRYSNSYMVSLVSVVLGLAIV